MTFLLTVLPTATEFVGKDIWVETSSCNDLRALNNIWSCFSLSKYDLIGCVHQPRLIELCRDCTIVIVTYTKEAMASDNGSSHNRAGVRIHTISLITLLQTSHIIVHCIHEKSAHANAVKVFASCIGGGFLPTHYRWPASCKVHWLSSMLLATTTIHKLIHQCIVIQHCNHKYCNCLVLSYNSQMCCAVESSFTKYYLLFKYVPLCVMS